MHRHTCSTLIRNGVHVVGIVECRREGAQARVRQLRQRLKRNSLLETVDQVAARLIYRMRNGRLDARELAALVDAKADEETLASSGVPVIHTDSYSRADTFDGIVALRPDILVVHSPFIVGPRVLALTPGRVIGGHPGITPAYRGSYSAFWAIVHDRPELVGWTVFVLDNGIDTGVILAQETLAIGPSDTHMTLSWRGMAAEATTQARIIRSLDNGDAVPTRAVGEIPANSYFGAPTIRGLLLYFRKESAARAT